MGDWFGGGGGEEEQPQQTYQEPAYFYPPTPMINPYQQLMGGTGLGAAQELLAGGISNVPQVNSPGFVPTSGWAGTGNAGVIPGAAAQLLRMRTSPQYLWS